jgi:hypothetical protein
MTLSDDFLLEEGQGQGDYPTAFGITFTPVISGMVLAILGIVGGGYIYMNMVVPAKESYEQVKTQQQEKQTQLEQVKNGDIQQQIQQLQSDLANKQAVKLQVTSLFTNQKDLDTLLLDISSFIAANQGVLLSYQPEGDPVVIQDGSLGNEVNGKLKRQGVSLNLEGTYSQTKSILRDLERLQPLLLVQSYSSKIKESPGVFVSVDRKESVQQEEAILSTQLKIDAILPLNPQEIAEQQPKTEESQQSQ